MRGRGDRPWEGLRGARALAAVALCAALAVGPAWAQVPGLPAPPTPAELQKEVAAQAAAAQCAAAGCIAWSALYREAGCCGRTPLALSPNGSVAYAAAGGALLGLDVATGQLLWVGRDGVAPWHPTKALASAVSPDGKRVFVAREGLDGWGGGRYVFVTAHDPARGGAVLWRSALFGGIEAFDLLASADGRLAYLAGGDGDAFLMALDAATGAVRWKTRYDGPARGFDVANDAALSPDGSTVYLAGATTSGEGVRTTDLDFLTLSLDAASGALVWAARFEGHADGEDRAWAVAPGPDGVVYVTGHGFTPETKQDIQTVAYRADSGSVLWSATFNTPSNRNDVGRAVAAAPDGSLVYVTGEAATPATGLDVATLAYEGITGRLVWVAFYDSTQRRSDAGRAIALGPTGGVVFVAGEVELSSSNRDYALLAYDAATGAPLGTAQHAPSTAVDGAAALQVGPGGARMVVAGHAENGQAMAVVAYQNGAAVVANELAGSL